METSLSEENIRPWGYYEILSDDKPGYKVKRIVVWPSKRLSLQFHKRRKEHWFVVSGKAKVTIGERVVDINSSQAFDIEKEERHRIENIGNEPLVFIEIQQGDYFGEDDIVRLEDDFGRP